MNYYKQLLSTSLYMLLAIALFAACQEVANKETRQKASLELDYPIQPIAFTDVKINDSFWAPRIETNRKVTIPYNFKKSEETGRIRNFAIAGGLEEGEFEGIFFNDSDVFKIIEGAAYSLMVHKDPELDQYLDDLIHKIAAAQEEDGYLYTNRTIDPSQAADSAGTERWTSLGIHHELYNVGHMYEAAVAHYQATGKRSLLDVALKNADLVDQVFGPGKNPGFPGHQEIEIGLVKLFRVTGEKRYLDLAKFFVDQRGSEAPYESEEKANDMKYQQAHKLLADQEEAVGHSVRAGYFYSGATDVAALTGETAYDKGLDKIWKDIVHQKIYLTGGIGAEPRHEGFGPDYELPNATAYTETCAAIALMFWNHRMFLRGGDVKYMDVFERTLYNGFLAGVSFEGNTFFYPNPLEADGVKKFNQGVCGRSPWFDCSCCPVNIVRVLPSLPGYIYAVKDEDVFVNLYIGNEAKFAVGGKELQIRQTTNYPWEGNIKIEIENDIDAHFNLRIPGWARNEVMPGDLYTYVDAEKPGILAKVNGEEVTVDLQSGYLSLEKKTWAKGDVIELAFEMPVRKVESHELVEANKGKIALERGPLVYCAEEIDNPGGVLNLGVSRETPFNYSYDQGLFSGLGKINGKTSAAHGMKDFTAIPYYAWAHRKMGEMAVWLAEN